MSLDAREARNMLRALRATLGRIVERDPEQEVQGIALNDAVSPEAIASGEPLRAVDALIAADLLFEALRDARG